MAGEKNVFITSLSALSNRTGHSYYLYEADGQTKYCDGLSGAEAGAKYLLSNTAINHIIVVGGSRTYEESEETGWLVLRDSTTFTSSGIQNLSEYGFFQYRLSQFLNSIDLEALDVLEDISADRMKELLEGGKKLFTLLHQRYPQLRPDRVFHMLAHAEDHEKLLKEAYGDLSDHDLYWVKRMLYTQLSDQLKLAPRQDNEDISICFVPMRYAGENNYVPAQNVSGLVKVLREIGTESLNIYMDMQGLESAEGYMILGVLSMLEEDKTCPIRFREIITTMEEEGGFVRIIDNREMKRYDINRLVTGMSAFIRYGKVDEILRYWRGRNINDRHVDILLYAMKQVDEGVSLCNIGQLETGIHLLKQTLAQSSEEAPRQLELSIFRILENTIRMDYGALLEGDTLDELELVRWAFRKKFYQQAVTIIESRMPQDFLERRILYYAEDEDQIKEFKKELNRVYWETLPKDRWSFKDLEHYFIKFYGRSVLPNIPDPAERQRKYTELRVGALDADENYPIKKAYSVLKDRKDLLSDLLLAYYNTGDVRNRMNHAQNIPAVQPDDLHQENPHLRIVREAVMTFIEAYDKARAWMKEQNLNPETPLQIDAEAFKNYTYYHRPKGRNANKALKKDKVKKDKPKNAVFAAESAEGTAGSGIEITIRVNR